MWPFAKPGMMIPCDETLSKFAEKIKPPPVCATCGCYVEESVAQTVVVERWTNDVKFFYCKSHRKPYTRHAMWLGAFYAEVQVDENGCPVGYEKTKPTKGGKGV